ncbi:ABC transporter permease [Halocalculus aciditolerans]|uniref:ABC transporter permease n=1 Tax=Halocalculus aciditolerans TaxID=1383812 RepID=A0A830FII3_9EURY|nr:ABC transporter permease [Halocalculus aciditolerans]GGL59154.1 ABC transporter permease [Halocalculus aciditolerans]
MTGIDGVSRRAQITLGAGVAAAVGLVLTSVFAQPLQSLTGVFDVSYFQSALRLTVPIAFAALGGIFAEKSGVINIGLEGLLIIAAFTGVAVTSVVGSGDASQSTVWIGFAAAVVASVLLSLVFAVICIEYKADQIIAGLAVWLVALGFAPFASNVIWGNVNSPSVPTLDVWFGITPTVWMLLIAVPVCWHVLYNTNFGYWVRASGENPKALDTVGVDVRKVRYSSVLISGFLSGIGGAGLALGQVGQFIGGGTTMVSGRGWIAITAYLFGNYNPLGAFGASFLFAALNALQVRLQQIGLAIPSAVIEMIPYITVIIVLALVGRTRVPDAAGEHYDTGEDQR